MTLLDIIQTVGIVAVLGAFLYIGRKLQILDDLKTTTEKIKVNIKVVCDHLIITDGVAFDNGKLQTYSPTKLTDLGLQYLRDLHFLDVFNENQGDFYTYIETEDPKSDFDIEAAATRSVSILFAAQYFQPVKDYFYNNPKTDRNEFIQVAGIYVRDRYMEWIEKRSKK